MSRSDWNILAAFAGLAALVIAFGLGSYVTALNDTQEERYQPYRYTAEQPSQTKTPLTAKPTAQPLQYRTPCGQPEGQGESDLCAQWRAANAAEDSALWTKWGFWIGVVGSTLLLWQIILTRKAVEDTSEATEAMREANRIADEAAKREARAYIRIDLDDDRKIIFEPGKKIVVAFNVINYGLTPAINSNFKFTCGIVEEGWMWGEEHIAERNQDIKVVIHKDVKVKNDVTMETEMTDEQHKSIMRGESLWVGRAINFYDDVFGDEHHTQITIEMRAHDVARSGVSFSRQGNEAT
jgi:hypothetical protein